MLEHNPNMEYTITLTDVEVEIIGKGLQELPFKYALPVIQKLQKQCQEQGEKAEETSND
jgi:hypothetical protein